jgi:hypothetical protein
LPFGPVRPRGRCDRGHDVVKGMRGGLNRHAMPYPVRGVLWGQQFPERGEPQ